MHVPVSDAGSARTRAAHLASAAVLAILPLASPGRAGAQTDYYNTDRGRPVQIEDAYAAERHAFELKLAPVRVEWSQGAGASWGIEPEIAYGLLPRTHLEIGVPIAFADSVGNTTRSGVAGLEISLMHNFNAETSTLPALGLRADVLAPVGRLAAERTYATFTGMLTRTFPALRVHVNGQYTAGAEPRVAVPSPSSSPAPPAREYGEADVSRWLAGLAIDKTFPLKSFLLTAEAFARQPIFAVEEVEYVAGAGLRVQTSPTVALDFGAGRQLNGDARAWYATFGMAYAFGIRALMPGGGR